MRDGLATHRGQQVSVKPMTDHRFHGLPKPPWPPRAGVSRFDRYLGSTVGKLAQSVAAARQAHAPTDRQSLLHDFELVKLVGLDVRGALEKEAALVQALCFVSDRGRFSFGAYGNREQKAKVKRRSRADLFVKHQARPRLGRRRVEGHSSGDDALRWCKRQHAFLELTGHPGFCFCGH